MVESLSMNWGITPMRRIPKYKPEAHAFCRADTLALIVRIVVAPGILLGCGYFVWDCIFAESEGVEDDREGDI